ncbi:MAG TPA: diguanylate cyclase [Syntrophales bacterium]|nr:diguanylate cyclase [Syntrophales bacterium]
MRPATGKGKTRAAKEGIEGLQDLSAEGRMVLRTILEGFSIPTFVIGRDHRVLYWNRALQELSGLPADRIIGTREHWRAFYSRERPCMADLIADGLQDEISRWYSDKYKKSNLIEEAFEATDFFPALGSSGKWLRFTATALRDVEGNLIGALETLEDITEGKLAEMALRESEKRLKTILEGSPTPAFLIDGSHRILYWNRALEELTGVKGDVIIGTGDHWKAFYKERRPCMADLLADGRLDEIPRWYGDRYQESKLLDEAHDAISFFPDLGNGGKWLRITAAVLRDSQGRFFGSMETLQDITETVQAEEALKESEQRLKSVLEGSPIPTFVIGRSHEVIYWNRALEELSEIRAEKIIGTKNHWKAFYDKARPCMADLLVDSLLDEIPRWYVGKYLKSKLIDDAYEATDFFPALGGGGKWLRFTAAALRDSKGVLFGAIETLEDITARKLAEEALKESEKKYMELSITDGLTKLYNSRHFYSQLKSEINRANRYRHPLSLLLLDIDDFKKYNDTFGHLEGDKVLIRLGHVIRRSLRKTDSAYRYGGEEFTAVLPETSGEAAMALAERIRSEFANESFSTWSITPVRKTVSIGIAEYDPDEELSVFLKRTDESMYRAKKKGKNRVYFGGKGLPPEEEER